MSGHPPVTVKLMRDAKASKSRVIFGLILRRGIRLQDAEVEEHGALDPTGTVKGTLTGITPGHNDVSAGKWNRRFEMAVGGDP